MDTLLKQLSIIKDVGERLKDLSRSRAVPANVIEGLVEQSKSIQWAHQELYKLYVADVLVMVGHSQFLDSIDSLQGSTPLESKRVEDVGDFSLAILLAPDKIIAEKIKEQFSRGWTGNNLTNDKTPKWLLCEKYFGLSFREDLSKRAVLFDCRVARHWLNEVGYSDAKEKIKSWAISIYYAMRWDEAQPVE